MIKKLSGILNSIQIVKLLSLLLNKETDLKHLSKLERKVNKELVNLQVL
jgi:hypothetical protein